MKKKATTDKQRIAEAHAFARRLKALGLLSPTKAALALGVSRFAVMHWLSGRRPVPSIAQVALDGIENKRRAEFLT